MCELLIILTTSIVLKFTYFLKVVGPVYPPLDEVSDSYLEDNLTGRLYPEVKRPVLRNQFLFTNITTTFKSNIKSL